MFLLSSGCVFFASLLCVAVDLTLSVEFLGNTFKHFVSFYYAS